MLFLVAEPNEGKRVSQGVPQLVDLSQCEREAVHLPGSIQPFGVLIAFSLPTWTVAHVSENAAALFGAESPGSMVDKPMDSILSPRIIHDLRNVFQAAMISGFAERLPGVSIGVRNEQNDILIHGSGHLAIAEFFPLGGADMMRADPTTLVKTIIDRLRRTNTFQSFLTSAARQIRAVTGFDRVMIYKFLEDDSGEVVAEALRAGMTPFMGLHYPASDIPSQARALLQRQWLRMIPQVHYTPVPIHPPLTSKNEPLDLSLSTLRSASPIHCQYLSNMGSEATMTVSNPARRSAVGLDRLPSRDATTHLLRDERRRRTVRPGLLNPDRGQAAARRTGLHVAGTRRA